MGDGVGARRELSTDCRWREDWICEVLNSNVWSASCLSMLARRWDGMVQSVGCMRRRKPCRMCMVKETSDWVGELGVLLG